MNTYYYYGLFDEYIQGEYRGMININLCSDVIENNLFIIQYQYVISSINTSDKYCNHKFIFNIDEYNEIPLALMKMTWENNEYFFINRTNPTQHFFKYDNCMMFKDKNENYLFCVFNFYDIITFDINKKIITIADNKYKIANIDDVPYIYYRWVQYMPNTILIKSDDRLHKYKIIIFDIPFDQIAKINTFNCKLYYWFTYLQYMKFSFKINKEGSNIKLGYYIIDITYNRLDLILDNIDAANAYQHFAYIKTYKTCELNDNIDIQTINNLKEESINLFDEQIRKIGDNNFIKSDANVIIQNSTIFSELLVSKINIETCENIIKILDNYNNNNKSCIELRNIYNAINFTDTLYTNNSLVNPNNINTGSIHNKRKSHFIDILYIFVITI